MILSIQEILILKSIYLLERFSGVLKHPEFSVLSSLLDLVGVPRYLSSASTYSIKFTSLSNSIMFLLFKLKFYFYSLKFNQHYQDKIDMILLLIDLMRKNEYQVSARQLSIIFLRNNFRMLLIIRTFNK